MRLAIIALAALAAGGSTVAMAAKDEAPAGAAPARQCFRSHDIRNHTVADDKTMYIDVGGRAVYRVDMRGRCLTASSSTDPIITRQRSGTDLVCRPIDLDISISRSGFESACIVQSITKLTPTQVAALPPKLRP